MLELLQQYSIKEIVIFVIVLAAAIKGIISFWDWGIVRLRKIFNKETNEERRQEEINNKLENDNRRINELIDSQKELQLLIVDKKVSFDGNTASFNSSYFCYKMLPKEIIFTNLDNNNSNHKKLIR